MSIKNVLADLREFVEKEHNANQEKFQAVWQKPLEAKLKSGESQKITHIKREGKSQLILTLGEGESRFREGDMLCLHQGDPFTTAFVKQATIEDEYEDEWLIRLSFQDSPTLTIPPGDVYADPDTMDLKPFYDKALEEIARSTIGESVILPMLADELDTDFIYTDNYDDAADFAEQQGLLSGQPLNDSQIDAVAKGVAAKYIACIQGPPGTGKTRVISLIAKQLVNEGHRVLVTSHTHMAINNALNKIAREDVPLAKVGAIVSRRGLDNSVPYFANADDWRQRPDSGYVIGATPFATCTSRLENFDFDTLIFDEASQITVPLAVMAMRKARRYIFVGDHKQLPPVVLSKSVLNSECYSVFSTLMQSGRDTFAMLNQTYRLSEGLSRWPSQQFYEGRLESAGENKTREFHLSENVNQFSAVFSAQHHMVFIQSPGNQAKNHSRSEANLVADLISTAINAGMAADDIGVVSPFRSQGKLLRQVFTQRFGIFSAKKIVTDTVERMQGQERELIIISLCTTDRLFLKAIAAFFFQSERLNVAITRPKTKLIIIGPRLEQDFTDAIGDKELIKQIEIYQSLVNNAFDCTAILR